MNGKLRYQSVGLLMAILVLVNLLLGAAVRPVAAESPYNSQPMALDFIELQVQKLEGPGGADESYMLVDGIPIWKKDSHEGDRHNLRSLTPFVFTGSINITLMEEDWPSGDDYLGNAHITGAEYEQLEDKPSSSTLYAAFTGDDAGYKLTYRVRPATREEIGLTLKPSHASGKCLDAPWEQFVVSGANLQQWDCGVERIYLTQRFRLKPAGSGYYTIAGAFNNRHLCLDVEGNSTKNGAPVQQSNCHGQDNQLWRLVDMGNGKFQIVSKRSNKCLDVAWDSERYAHSNGARIQQWDCYGPNQLNQLWEID